VAKLLIFLIFITNIRCVIDGINLLQYFRVIKSRIIGWAVHEAGVGRGEAYTGFWLGDLRARVHLRDPGVDGRLIVRWMFRK